MVQKGVKSYKNKANFSGEKQVKEQQLFAWTVALLNAKRRVFQIIWSYQAKVNFLSI